MTSPESSRGTNRCGQSCQHSYSSRTVKVNVTASPLNSVDPHQLERSNARVMSTSEGEPRVPWNLDSRFCMIFRARDLTGLPARIRSSSAFVVRLCLLFQPQSRPRPRCETAIRCLPRRGTPGRAERHPSNREISRGSTQSKKAAHSTPQRYLDAKIASSPSPARAHATPTARDRIPPMKQRTPSVRVRSSPRQTSRSATTVVAPRRTHVR